MIIEIFVAILIIAIVVIGWLIIDLIIRQVKFSKPENRNRSEILADEDTPVILIEPGGKVKYCSPAARKLFDIPTDKKFNLDIIEEKTQSTTIYQILNTPGKISIVLNDAKFDVQSYQTSDGMLVTFSPTTSVNQKGSDRKETDERALQFLKKISAAHEFDQIIRIIAEEFITRHQADYVEIGIAEFESEEMITFQFLASLSDQKLYFKEKIPQKECLSGYIFKNKQIIRIDDTSSNELIPLPGLPNNQIQQFIGYPLMVANEYFGAIAFGNEARKGILDIEYFLKPDDISQLAVALKNAWVYQELKVKSSELDGLSKLSVSFSHIQDPKELFQTILTNYKELLPVDILGFLLFDERTNILEAKSPFKGLPDPIVDIIRIKIEPNSPAEKIINSQDILIIDNAAENSQWEDLGLSHLASAASIQEAILIPLAPSSEPMGYLLAANHNNGTSSFSQDEIHSLMIIANQTGPLIENLFLLLQSKLRAQRAEVLRRVSSIANSNATTNEIYAFTVNELSLLLRANSGGLFLVDQTNTKLVWDDQSKFGDWAIPYDQTELLLTSEDFQSTVTNTKESLVIGKFDETKPIPSYYQKIIDHSEIQSALIVPLIIKNKGIGELWFGSEQLSFFDQGDVHFILSAANQLAYVVDQTKLSVLTMNAINEKIEQEKVIEELQKINEFSKKIARLDVNQILEKLLNTLFEFIPEMDAGWIGLLDDVAQLIKPTFIKSYTDDLRSILFRQNSLPFKACESGEILDLDEVEFPLQYRISDEEANLYMKATHHQVPLSAIFASIRINNQSIGVLVLEIFDFEKRFTPENKSILLSFLQQSSYALENANLIESLKNQSIQMERLSTLSKSITANLNLLDLSNSLLKNLKSIVDYQTATFWEKDKKYLKIVATDGFEDHESRLGLKVQIDDSLLFQEMFASKKPLVVDAIKEDERFSSLVEPENLSWLGIPLISDEEIIGVIALEKKERNYYVPDRVRLAEAFASQAAISLENARLFEAISKREKELNERSLKLTQLHHFSTEINRLLDVAHINSLSAKYLVEVLNCEMISVYLNDESGNVSVVFETPDITKNPNLIIQDQGLFHKLTQTRGVYQIVDLVAEPEIESLRENYFNLRKIKSILFVPLLRKDEVLGWLGLESTTSRRYGHTEIELAQTIANQTASAINNALLLKETVALKENLEEKVHQRTQELLVEHRNTELLLGISNELAASMDVDQILTGALEKVNQTLKLSGSFIFVFENKKTYQLGEDEDFSKSFIPKNLRDTLFEQVRKTKTIFLNDDIHDLNLEIKSGSLLLAPVIFGNITLGILGLFHNQNNFFSKRDSQLAEAIARQLSTAINNIEIYDIVREQSENLGSLLREQEVGTTRSRGILEAVADGVLVTGVQGEILLINQSAMDIFNFSDPGRQKTLEELHTFLGGSITPWITTIQQWTQKPDNLSSHLIYSEQINLKNNRVISIHLTPVIWKNEFLGTVSVFRDITFEVQIDRLKSDFISNISHELRTPLTSIKGYVEVLLLGAGGNINEQQKHFLEIIQLNTARLNNLLDDILDMSRIESGHLELKLNNVDLKQLLFESIELQKNITSQEKKEIEYYIDYNSSLQTIIVDPERIRQILMNVLSNARIYSHKNGKIEVHVSDETGFLKIVIKDKGIGVPKEEQEHVFERFFRGRNAQEFNAIGVGLGLSVAQTLINMHAGRIELESNGVSGEGTTVTMWLPILDQQAG